MDAVPKIAPGGFTASPLSRDLNLGSGRLTFAVKDNFDIAGIPTTMGSSRFAARTPAASNAQVVSQLLSSNHRLVGTACMHELAYGVTGRNPWQGTVCNPLWPSLIVGGSSSGCAAAVAAELVDFSIGTDTGGSVRMPAACCGVVGLKPTFGRVSHHGVHPRHSTLDCVGAFARDVATIEQVMTCIADGFEPISDEAPLRAAILASDCDADVAVAFAQVASRLCLEMETCRLDRFDAAFQAGLTIIGAEMWAEYSWLAPDYHGIGDDVAARLARASRIDAAQIAEAERVRIEFAAQVDHALETVDVLLLPTLPCTPPTIAEAEDAAAQIRLTRLIRPFNLSGHPAMTVPIRIAAGLPAAVQVIGRKGADAVVCAYGKRIELAVRAMTANSHDTP